MSPAGRRAVVDHFRSDFDMSERRACSLAGQSRSVQQYRSVAKPIDGLLERLIELAGERPRFGYRRLTILLRREDFQVNHKRVWRLHQRLGLAVRRRRRKRASQASRVAQPTAVALTDVGPWTSSRIP